MYGKRLSAIPIVTTHGVEDVFFTDKNVNGDIFLQFVDQCLVPVLQPFNGSNARSVVVMDNASIRGFLKSRQKVFLQKANPLIA